MASMAWALLFPLMMGCGRKGDPIPRLRAEAQPCAATWVAPHVLEVTLPRRDIQDQKLLGLRSLRIYYLPLGAGRPTPGDVLQRGEVILERTHPDLPKPGSTFRITLDPAGRSAGWIVLVAVRGGGRTGQPSPTLPWLHPVIR